MLKIFIFKIIETVKRMHKQIILLTFTPLLCDQIIF